MTSMFVNIYITLISNFTLYIDTDMTLKGSTGHLKTKKKKIITFYIAHSEMVSSSFS